MSDDETNPPVSDDEFPEFEGPPRAVPAPGTPPRSPRPRREETDEAQKAADAVMERLRKKREGSG